MAQREGIDKKESVKKEVITEFVNIALASSKIQKIEIEQQNGIFDLRPNLNLFLYGSIGSTKSTLLNQISKQTNCKKPFTDLTYPALIGSVDKMTRQLIVGSCWDCRNSLLLLDEFDFNKRKRDDIRALLQLVEGGEYNKKLASFSSPTSNADGDLYYKFDNGEFNIKTRFALIVATMKYPFTSQNIELQALASRSVCLAWYPTKEELAKVAQGYALFKYKDITPKKLEIFVKKKDYEKILKLVEAKTNGKNFLRIVGDCVRVFAVCGEHRQDLYDLIIRFGSKQFSSKLKSGDDE